MALRIVLLIVASQVLACGSADGGATPRAPAALPEPAASESPAKAANVHAAPTSTASAPATAPAPPRFKQPLVPREQTRIVVLEYHDFGNVDRPNCVDPVAFGQQLDWLLANEIEVVRTSDVVDFYAKEQQLPEKVAVVMIDDALTSAKNHAFPALSKRSLPFTLAINTAPVEISHEDTVTWSDLKLMLDSGLCEIASHSHKHGHMANLTDVENNRELNRSKELLEKHLGVTPRAFVYPFGSVNAQVQKLTEAAGYEAGFDAFGPVATSKSPRFRIPRTAITRDTKLWLFPKLWSREFGPR